MLARPTQGPETARANREAAPLVAHNSIVGVAAGPFADQITTIWAGPRIVEYLAATDQRRHAWHAWLSSHADMMNEFSIDHAYQILTFARGRDLIQQAYGQAPAGVMRALGLLWATARRKEVYRALVGILRKGGPAAKFLRHAREFQDELILGLNNLTPGRECDAALAMYRRGRIGAESLGFLSATAARLRVLLGPQVAAGIFHAQDPLKALWAVLLDLPFAAPPWAENQVVVPVTSRKRLVEIAHAFKNCLRDDYWQKRAVVGVTNGNLYYYEGKNSPFLIEVARLGRVGWYITQAYGPENSEIRSEVRDEIVQSLSFEETFCGAWIDHNSVEYLIGGLGE